MNPLRGVIFDLDGVLADSASGHFKAWKALADELAIPFDLTDNERLKGVDRMTSLEIILEKSSISYNTEQKQVLAQRKNAYYQQIIEEASPADLIEGALALLQSLKDARILCGLASASKNAPFLVERLGLSVWLDYVADANAVTASKPAPDIFQLALKGLKLQPDEAIGIEDAVAGVQAIHAAGMKAIAIGPRELFGDAECVLPRIADLTLEQCRRTHAGPRST